MKNVTVIQGDRNKKLLDSVSLTVLAGENVAILGPNGAGKTSLIRTITREYYPVARRNSVLRVMGEDHWNLFELRDLLGIVSSDLQSACAREMPGIEMILSGFFGGIGLHRGQRVTAGMRKKAGEALRFLEIAHLKDRSMSVMSSGEARRFLIGRAIIHDPKVLILDEPTNGLDPAGTKEIRDLIPKLAHESRAVLLCSHLLHEVEMVCDHVAIVKQGIVIANSPIKELLSHGNLLQIRVNDVEKATLILRGISWIKSIKKEDDYLVLDIPGERSAEVNMALVQKGIMVSELVNRTSSLESVFLQLTGGTSGD